jgi:DNA-binding response OmpR family regulator
MVEVPIVLVADDEEMILDIVGLVLRRAGYRVIEAKSGDEAVELAARSEEPILLALLDMEIPGLSGAKLFLRLQELDPQIRGLFMSGNDAAATEIPAGCSFMAKPFTTNELLKRVREATDRPIAHHA